MKNRIRELREAQGLSMMALAEKLGTTKQNLSYIEKGIQSISVERMLTIARELHVHPLALLDEEVWPDNQTDLLDQSLSGIRGRMSAIERRLRALDSTVGALHQRFDQLQEQLDRISKQLDEGKASGEGSP